MHWLIQRPSCECEERSRVGRQHVFRHLLYLMLLSIHEEVPFALQVLDRVHLVNSSFPGNTQHVPLRRVRFEPSLP